MGKAHYALNVARLPVPPPRPFGFNKISEFDRLRKAGHARMHAGCLFFCDAHGRFCIFLTKMDAGRNTDFEVTIRNPPLSIDRERGILNKWGM
jgi:hypothetical protein